MLTAITIENFKGISGACRIDLRPITILFGKNSAGKSTVLHALRFARSVLVTKGADWAEFGNDVQNFELTRFKDLVHQGDLKRSISISIETDISDFGMPSYGNFEQWLSISRLFEDGLLSERQESILAAHSSFEDRYRGGTLEHAIYAEANNGFEAATRMEVRFTLSWDEKHREPFVESYETFIGTRPSARILTSGVDGPSTYQINFGHPLLAHLLDEPKLAEWGSSVQWSDDLILASHTPLPRFGSPVGVDLEQIPLGLDFGAQTASEMLVAPGEIAEYYLARLRHLGPWRNIPAESNLDRVSWFDGSAGWARLHEADQDLVEEANAWLDTGLNTGHGLTVEAYREVQVQWPERPDLLPSAPTESLSELPIKRRIQIVDRRSGMKLAPKSVGVGISQVVPVIVAALDSKRGVLAIEQPELHLHPAAQTGLGDLLMRGAGAIQVAPEEVPTAENVILVETLSEHLILRLLRRIREGFPDDEVPTNRELWKCIRPEFVSLIYVESDSGETKFKPIPITADGELAVPVPGGFFSERAEELF